MANTSIFKAFERMWQQICTKADITHAHTWESITEKPENLATTEDIASAVEGLATEEYVDQNGGKIDVIAVNGTDQIITNKKVDITVPTKTSELTNDSGYLTDHQDISGKADKSYVDSQDEATLTAAKSHTNTKFTELVGDTAVPAQINTAVSGKADKTYVDTQDTTTLNSAKSYTDTKIANLLENDTAAVDSIMELAEAMKNNADAIDALTTISGNKVDKVEGKDLSTNDYTTDEKNKLAGIEAGAKVNVQSDWNATSGDALILNKPTIPSKVSELTNDSGYLTEHQDISGKADQTYVDSQDTATLNSAKGYADTQDEITLASAKSYTDTEISKVSTLVGDTAVSTQIDTALVDKANKTQTVQTTMLAANWTDGQYSFEETYPAATYDIDVMVDGSVATAEQFEAFNAAMLTSSATTNVAKAFGDVPTIDIPVILKVQVK